VLFTADGMPLLADLGLGRQDATPQEDVVRPRRAVRRLLAPGAPGLEAVLARGGPRPG
jgi:hypothetical protein